MPHSDRTALSQVTVMVIVVVAATWLSRRERAITQRVLGTGLVMIGLMAMRTLH